MFGLTEQFVVLGNEAVLGPSLADSQLLPPNGIPVEQAVCRQRLRPGSGFLAVNVITDGPTRVLEITDVKEKVKHPYKCFRTLSLACDGLTVIESVDSELNLLDVTILCYSSGDTLYSMRGTGRTSPPLRDQHCTGITVLPLFLE